jgi:hypothetical protein
MNAHGEHESTEDELDRQMQALRPPDPPEDLLPRCLATIGAASRESV